MEINLLLWVVCIFYVTRTGGMITQHTTTSNDQSTCGSWNPYTDDKCVRIADVASFQTKQEAESICSLLAETEALDDIPRLVTAKSEVEQRSLKQFLFEEMGLLDHVWLGADTGADGILRWHNVTELHYNNLAEQNITGTDRQCVQMESGQGIYPMGQWVRVNCRKRNVVACEKLQVWTAAKLQNDFLNFKSTVERDLGKLRILQGNEVEAQMKADSFKKIPGTTPIACKEPTQCTDWQLYKDEKCFKIVEKAGYQSQEEAEIDCSALSEELTVEALPRLITIKNQEEQDFIYNVLFKQEKLIDNVWLGMRKEENSSVYKWNDGSEVMYSNWVEQNITEDDRNCVQMESGRGFYPAGKWVKVHCQKRTTVVCERLQTLTQVMLRKMFLNSKLEQKTKEEQWNQKIINLTRELEKKEEQSNQKISNLEKKCLSFEKEIESLKQQHSSNHAEKNAGSRAELVPYCRDGKCVWAECTGHRHCIQCATIGKRGHCSNDYKCSCLDCAQSHECADCPPGTRAVCKDGTCYCKECFEDSWCTNCPLGRYGQCQNGRCSCVGCRNNNHCPACVRMWYGTEKHALCEDGYCSCKYVKPDR